MGEGLWVEGFVGRGSWVEGRRSRVVGEGSRGSRGL